MVVFDCRMVILRTRTVLELLALWMHIIGHCRLFSSMDRPTSHLS